MYESMNEEEAENGCKAMVSGIASEKWISKANLIFSEFWMFERVHEYKYNYNYKYKYKYKCE